MKHRHFAPHAPCLLLAQSHEGVAWSELFAAYDNILARHWPTFSSTTVPTSFGCTHVNLAGPLDGPLVLLIHGSGASSVQWASLSKALSTKYRVIAPDLIAEVGRSVLSNVKRTPASDEEIIEWMHEVINGLGLQGKLINIVGFSYGSWVAAKFASRSPEIVKKLVLISPAGIFYPLSAWFFLKVLPAVIFKSEARILAALQYMTKDGSLDPLMHADILRFFVASFRSPHFDHKPLPPPAPLPDDSLRCITARTLLLVGEFERVNTYGPAKALARARRYLPHCETKLVTGE